MTVSTTTVYKLLTIASLPLILFSATSCAQSPTQDEFGNGDVNLDVAFENLEFTRPVDLQAPDDGSNRLFVVEQAGIIRVFENVPDTDDAPVFLDISDRVNDAGNEEGLLGLAFHPDYASNGEFFVDYTASNPRRTVIARYQVDPNDPLQAQPGSEEVILEIDQPFGNHNGGQIAFGSDRALYIAMGDGGSGGDPQGHGQNRSTLLGTILRIDVDRQDEGRAYAIPEDNPYAANDEGYREEIYAYGLRNPWRFSFDPETDRLWTGDVGQNQYEEVDVIESGGNYGWNVMEGFHCFEPPTGCDTEGLIEPVAEYDHSEGQSITGGFVYRGENVPALSGKYVYADYVSGKFWTLEYDGAEGTESELFDTSLNVSAFGLDRDRELYVLAFDGNIYHFTSGSDVPAGGQ